MTGIGALDVDCDHEDQDGPGTAGADGTAVTMAKGHDIWWPPNSGSPRLG